MKKFDGFYAKISGTMANRAKDINQKLQFSRRPSGDSVSYADAIEFMFGQYWPEFVEFWKQSGETPEKATFMYAPHNAIMFIEYCLKCHPEVDNSH